MAKLIKGNIVQNIITDGDVIVTSPSKIGKTLDEVLDEQQSDIDRLKSNVKYIYAYGGVGGSGSGGSGSSEKPVSILITLNGVAVSNGGNAIILDGKGVYKLYVKVSNAGGKNLYMGYSTMGGVTDKMMNYKLNGDNKYRSEIDITLNSNGDLSIRIDDDEGNTLAYYTQKYIVDTDIFNVNLNYVDINGETKSYTSEPYECFVTDPNRTNRHFKIDYSVFLTDYTEAKIKCEIDGINEPIYEGSESSVIIPIEGEECGVLINGEPILQNKNMGIYTLRATLTYKITGKEVVRTRTLMFSVVPSGLYINVRTNGDVLYDDIDLLRNDILNGMDGIPHKCISQYSSLMLYCKVFEGSMDGYQNTYVTTFKTFNAEVDDSGNIVLDNGNIVWETNEVSKESETLTEQVESDKGVSVTFPTWGIKKIEITTTGRKGEETNIPKTFVKYLFVKPFEEKCDWFNKSRYTSIVDSYFKANQGDDTYRQFPLLSSGNSVLSLTTSSKPVELSRLEWNNDISGNVCSVITLGIQVSNINSEDAKIVDIYTTTSQSSPKYTLRTTRLFTKVEEDINKIAIPTEILNKNDNSKYHLVQIVRSLSNASDGNSEFEDSLYIDGLLESVDRNISSAPSIVTKLILNNINICYNLINIQYFENTHKNGDEIIKFNTDAYAYQYWLAYKEKYVNSGSDNNRLSEAEIFIKENMDRIFFDGTNVVVSETIIGDISRYSELPSVVFGYNCKNGNEPILSKFMESMWAGRPNGDTTFNSRTIDLYWIPAGSGGRLSEHRVEIPSNFTDNTYGNNITGEWEIDLQGTSTMRNRIKNYSLRIKSNSSTGKDRILFSPDFDISNNRTFLPDIEWTIKADIADSAHANNTSIGKFVNEVCTQIDTNISDITPEAEPFIKNTLEGIPVLLYFMCEGKDDEGKEDIKKIYYFGVYNFNLGRNSYYNLGYTGGIVDEQSGESDFMRVFNNIKKGNLSKYYKDKVFTFAVGENALSKNIVIAEIQDNYPEFDFHQYNRTLLFKEKDSNIACMFGADSKITAVDKNAAKTALENLVRGIAKAGKYCFIRSGRENDFVTSREFSYGADGEILYGNNCVDRYKDYKIPDPKLQMSYVNNKVVWSESTLCDNVSEEDLKELITTFINSSGEENMPILNYNSASEYYTICMAFGMVDSVLKNMNLKSFNNISNPYFHCAFYDMDCALEEDNAGKESVSYLAATDYWYSPVNTKTNKVEEIVKMNDYWDRENGGQGFDFTSSYLFAVIKYAKSIFEAHVSGEDKYEDDTENYPQKFWAMLRNEDGELRSADYFIENYFKSGITKTFEYLASLNYRVKYLYRGETFDSNDKVIVQPLANAAAFNGSRRIKVKNWLTKRLRFMDVMMNVNGLHIPIADGLNIEVPIPPENIYKEKLSNNNDITILHSAFDSNQLNTALNSFQGEVEIYAPKHTPFIFASGSSKAQMYLLPGGIDKPNLLSLYIHPNVGTRFYGSGMFTSVDKIESMFTSYASVISDNIEKITYGGTPVSIHKDGFKIVAKSVTEIKLDIPNMGGELVIDSDCISLTKINIANSGFFGTFNNFPNLQEVNISGVKSSEIYVVNNDNLTGERFRISGSDEEHKTSLEVLEISGVTGNFNCYNTDIEDIRITNSTDRTVLDFDSNKLSEFEIHSDSRLRKLNLVGFRKVSITSCNNLETLSIDDALEEIYIDLSKINDETTSSLKGISFGSTVEDGVFDFSRYPNLKRVTLKNCDHLVHVKLPDNDIETDGMCDNPNLKWIDTGSLPAFLDNDNKTPVDGYIEGTGEYEGVKFPIYPEGPKLILCKEGVFKNCPNYNMGRSDWNKAGEMIGSSYINDIAYTNITVSESCTSLANTFSMSGSVSNSSDNCIFNMNTVIRFIEVCVPDNVKKNITSLSGCFKGRSNVAYTMSNAATDFKHNTHYYAPVLSSYESLNNIYGMYENTGVTFISRQLLSLPYSKNNPDNELSWGYFIGRMYMGIDIASDALENISYRLKSYSGFKFNIYEFNDSLTQYKPAGSSDNKFDICNFFYHIENDGVILPYSDITSIDSLNFDDQYIDFSGMFNLFPNVENISNFLNGNLGKYTIDGLLMPCKSIKSIYNSFCDDNVYGNIQIIDLYNFFNWENNTSVGFKKLFEGQTSDGFTNGFRIKKTISFDNFKKVLAKIADIAEKNDDFIRLTNIFSYCTITDYNGEEIKFEKSLNNIKNISFLFEKCTSDYRPLTNTNQNSKGIYTGGVLNIGRSFFENLPGFNIAYRTFADTYLSSPLTYDYFCKRGNGYTEKTVFLSESQSDIAKLYECDYRSDIINISECFCNTKFVDCKNWFDDKDNIVIDRNYIVTSDGVTHSEQGFVYYKYNEVYGTYEKYTLDNDIIDDCLYNYTDFVPQNYISDNKGIPAIWYNHDLIQDFTYYGNIKGGVKPFDPVNVECVNTIQKTYCCLPPDFLYGCSSSVAIDSIFTNSNIIGVIPRNLTKNIKSCSLSNIFKNVNIMPNLEYYYDINGGLDKILNEIEECVDIDVETIGDEYKVVFRDEYGKLKKRKPVNGDRNLGQFVYVPENFTTSGSLSNAFNFRYNLPGHWEMPSKNDVGVDYYKTSIEFNNAIQEGKLNNNNLTYHSQYYFTTDRSVKWNNLYDAKSLFIRDEQDIDFSNKNVIGKKRGYYDGDGEVDIIYKNIWTENVNVSKASQWAENIVEQFYIDLNLCGKKNIYNMIEDYGCPISIKNNRNVKLDNFVSGILTIFLNGRVFYDEFLVNDLTTSNHKSNGGSSIIDYYGFGKNIILPKFNGTPLDEKLVFIPINSQYVYYDFMVNNEIQSKSNYEKYFGKYLTNKDMLSTDKNKYTFK